MTTIFVSTKKKTRPVVDLGRVLICDRYQRSLRVAGVDYSGTHFNKYIFLLTWKDFSWSGRAVSYGPTASGRGVGQPTGHGMPAPYE